MSFIQVFVLNIYTHTHNGLEKSAPVKMLLIKYNIFNANSIENSQNNLSLVIKLCLVRELCEEISDFQFGFKLLYNNIVITV